MADYGKDFPSLIKFGIELISMGQPVTQHNYKFNETPKFCIVLGFSPVHPPPH